MRTAIAAVGLVVLVGGCSAATPDRSPTDAPADPPSRADGPVLGAFHVLLPDPAGRGVLLLTGPPEGVVDPGPMRPWRWDGQRWSPVDSSGPAPDARTFFAAAHDPERGVVVVHGGETAEGISEETWEWDGTAWRRADGATPGPRMSASLTFDPATGSEVLLGGDGPDLTISSETWAWDGTTWTRLARRGPEPARWPAAMVATGDGTLLAYGGHQVLDEDLPPALDDTWAWRDGAWAVLPDAGGPGALVNAQGLVHPRLGVLLLGGSDMDAESGDVWRWSGGRWEPFARDVLPPRQAFGAAYDAERDVVVLTGGVVEPGETTRHQDVWEWSGDPAEEARRVSARPPA